MKKGMVRGGNVEENFRAGRELYILVWGVGWEMEVPPVYLTPGVVIHDITQEGMVLRKPSV